MRELLFRGKRKDNGEWVYGGYARLSNHACFSHNLKYTHFIMQDESIDIGIGALVDYEVIPETVGQYTGLDVNGKKIFEGDIVRDLRLHLCHEREFEQGYINEEKYEAYRKNARTNVVSFCEVGSCGCCYEAFVGSGFAAFGIDLNECEVIGSIHDNKEILKGGAE